MASLTVTANSPVAGSITWSAFQFTYLGVMYNVATGSTPLLYSYFIYANRTSYVAPITDPVTGIITGNTANATLVSSATIPVALTDDDCLWLINRGGIPLNVQRTEIVDGSLIVTQSIVGTSIAARTIDANNIKADTITSAEIKALSITTDDLSINTYPPNTISNSGMEDFNPVTFVPTTWTPGWASSGAATTYSQTGATASIYGGTSTVMAVPASATEGLASAAAPCDGTSYLSGRKLVIQAVFRTTVATAPVSVRVYWGTTSTFTIASGLSVNTGIVPTVVEIINVDASSPSATVYAALAPVPVATAGVTSLLDYWTGTLANNTYLMTGQVAIPQGATWFRVVVSGGRSSYATAANYTWDEVQSQAVMYGTYIGDGAVVTRLLAADSVLANNIAIIGQRDPVTFQPVNGTNRVEIEPGGIYVYKRSAGGVDTMQAAMDNTTGAFIAGQLVISGSGTGITPGFVNNSGRVILDSTGLKGIYRDGTGVDTLKLNFDATTGNVNVAGAIQAGGTITGALVRSGAAAVSSNRVEFDAAGLRLIQRNASSVDTTVAELKTVDGSINLTGPLVTGGSLAGVTVTGSTVRTSATVGDGSAASAGVLLDVANGVRVFGASATVPHTTINSAGLTVTGGSLTGPTIRTAAAVGTGTGPAGIVIDSTGLRGYPINSTIASTTLDATTGALVTTGEVQSGGTVTGSLIRSGVGAPSSNRVEFDSTGLRLIQRSAGSVDTTVAELRTSDGSINLTGPIVTNGSITGATVTGGIVRTGATVGTGTGPSGVILDASGVRGFPLNSTVPNTTIDTITGVLTATGAVITGTITGALVRSAAPAISSSRTELDSAGLRLINRDSGGVDTTVVNISAAGAVGSISIVGGTLTTPTITTPAVSNGTLTGSVVRTSATVGDGSAASAGVRLDSTGLKGFPASSATPNTTIDTSSGVLTAAGAVITGTITGGLVRTAVPANSSNRVEMDSAGLRLVQRGAGGVDTVQVNLSTSTGAASFLGPVIAASNLTLGAAPVNVNGSFEDVSVSDATMPALWQRGLTNSTTVTCTFTTPLPTAPVVAAPTSTATGGTIINGTYYYKVSALDAQGETQGSNEAVALNLPPSVANPGPPTVTPTGTAGTTTYNYMLVGRDSLGRSTAGGIVGATLTGNATLSATNYNALSWTAVPGATSYDVYKYAAGYAYVLANTTATTLNDVGQALGAAGAPTANNTGTNTVSLSWAQVPGATGYKVYRSTTAGGESVSPSLLTTILSGSTVTYTDTGVAVTAGAASFIGKAIQGTKSINLITKSGMARTSFATTPATVSPTGGTIAAGTTLSYRIAGQATRYDGGVGYTDTTSASITATAFIGPPLSGDGIMSSQGLTVVGTPGILGPGTYYFKVTALSTSPVVGESVPSTEASIVVPPTPAPTGLDVNSIYTTGGTLAAGTHYYKIVGIGGNGGFTLASAELAVTTTGTTGSVQIFWFNTTAASWRVYYGTTPGGQNNYYSVPAAPAAGYYLIWTDTGAVGTAGTPPTTNNAGNGTIQVAYTTSWNAPVPSSFRVYIGTTAGGENSYFTRANVSNPYFGQMSTFNYDGTTAGTAGTPPAADTTSTNTWSSVVNWNSLAAASGYRLYASRTASGATAVAEQAIYTGALLTFTDTGAVAPSGAFNTANQTGQMTDILSTSYAAVTPGDTWYASVRSKSSSVATQSLSTKIRLLGGATVGSTTYTVTSAGFEAATASLLPGFSTKYEGAFVIPVGMNYATVQVLNDGTSVLPFDATNYTLTIDDVVLQKTVSGSLIVDGAIDGKTITGALVRTAVPTNSTNRVELDSAGLRLVQRNASGVDTSVVNLKTSDGSVTLVGNLTSGSTIVGSTISGTTIQNAVTSPTVVINSTGLQGFTYARGMTLNNSIGLTDTTIVVSIPPGVTTQLPPAPHYIDMPGSTYSGNPTETILVTAHASMSSWTVIRAQNGTIAQTHSAGDSILDTTGIQTLSIGSGGAAFTGSVAGGSVSIGTVTGNDFASAFTSTAIAGFTPQLGSQTWTGVAVTGSGNASGFAAHADILAGGVVAGYGVNTETSVVNFEVGTQWRVNAAGTNDGASVMIAYGRGSGSTSSNFSGYALIASPPYTFISTTPSNVTLYVYTNGQSQSLGTVMQNWVPGTYYKTRFRIQGNLIQAKVWSSVVQPVGWSFTVADSSISTAGAIGLGTLYSVGYLGTYTGTANVDFPYFNVTQLAGAFNVDNTGNVFVGGSTVAASPFSVTAAGLLTAANPTITGSINLPSTSAGIEIGSLSAVNGPFIDFHSSGANQDFDVRLQAQGGTSGTSGAGSLNMYTNNFYVRGSGGSYPNFALIDGTAAAAAPAKYLRSVNGNLDVINSAYNKVIFSINDSGSVAVNGANVYASSIMNGVPVAQAGIAGVFAVCAIANVPANPWPALHTVSMGSFIAASTAPGDTYDFFLRKDNVNQLRSRGTGAGVSAPSVVQTFLVPANTATSYSNVMSRATGAGTGTSTSDGTLNFIQLSIVRAGT